MTAPKVRADYDLLKQSAQAFGGQAEAAQKSLQTLQRDMDVLQGGDWVGVGATAFYQEMNSQVLPTMKRLANALQTAQQTTLQIQQVVKQAEEEAARWLRGEGSGAAAGLAAGVVPGPGSGGGSGSGGAGGGSAGGGGAATAAQQAAQAFKNVMQSMEAVGAAIGIGDALAVAFSKGAAEGLKNASPDMRSAIMKVLEEGAVDRKLSAFSQGARDIIKKSPTLRSEVFQVEQAGFNFKTGAVADGYYINRATSTIVIDQPLSDADTVSHIAHEIGHAVTPQRPKVTPTPTMTRDQFVNGNVDALMHNEGAAQFNAAQIRAELKAAGGPDTGIPGTQTTQYQAVYDDFTAGNITRDQAIDKMAVLMGNERVSTPPKIPYRDYYAQSFRDEWDTKIAPKRTK